MSRIIKAIINSALPSDNDTHFICGVGNKEELNVVKAIGGTFFSFIKNSTDTNGIIRVITDQELMNNLSIAPKYILNLSLESYQHAHHLSGVLKIPLINLFLNIDNLKKEGAFSIANVVNTNINFFLNKDFPAKLYLTNYHLIDTTNNLANLIETEILKWKPI